MKKGQLNLFYYMAIAGKKVKYWWEIGFNGGFN